MKTIGFPCFLHFLRQVELLKVLGGGYIKYTSERASDKRVVNKCWLKNVSKEVENPYCVPHRMSRDPALLSTSVKGLGDIHPPTKHAYILFHSL